MTTHLPAPPQLFGQGFAEDPHATYDVLRAQGPVAWAELSPGVHGLIITSHDAAIELLTTHPSFTRDSRTWKALQQGAVPHDSPLLSILGWHPTLLFADTGPAHARLHNPMRSCLKRVPMYHWDEVTGRAAETIVNTFIADGRAEIVTQYAMRVPLLVFAEMLGCPPETSQHMVDACEKIISAGPQAAQGAQEFNQYLHGLVELKQAQPGNDLTSWMLQHPQKLQPHEVVSNLFTLVGAGNVPTSTWIVQALRLLLLNDDYAGNLSNGSITVYRAMEKALWDYSPMANFTFYFAREDTTLLGVPVPAGYPVIISHAACNKDPNLNQNLGYDSRAHLAFSAGTHRCPAPTQAAIITQKAITKLLELLRGIHLVDQGPIPNRPGLFHQCPSYLNVTFDPPTGGKR